MQQNSINTKISGKYCVVDPVMTYLMVSNPSFLLYKEYLAVLGAAN
jgi:hypothetical protein